RLGARCHRPLNFVRVQGRARRAGGVRRRGAVRAFDFRAGGAFHTFMSGPDGGESDNPGCFLEVVEAQRIVFTTMLTSGWRPNSPWLGLNAIIAMADEADGSRYTARVMHKDAAESKRH
ncbi:MAG: SRPBCC domain-containing protein, partial [Rhodospirillaceae bacterium]